MGLSKLGQVLRLAGYREVEEIATAAIPIVKCVDRNSSLRLEISCNNRVGVLKTEFMAAYCAAWSGLRPMLTFLKAWAKSWSLNDSSGSKGPVTFSSWAISLMTVAFLQVRSPGSRVHSLVLTDSRSQGHQDTSKPPEAHPTDFFSC